MAIHPELVDALANNPDWIYFGGGVYKTEYDTIGTHHKYFHKAWPCYFKDNPELMIPYEERCVCNQKIQQQCYIMNKKTLEFIVLGNCCIKKLRNCCNEFSNN